MTEVDWLLDQFALILDERDVEIASLTARLAAQQPADDEADMTSDEPAEVAPAADEEEQPRA
jgi:hypothetical protein